MSAGAYLFHGTRVRADGALAARLADELLAPYRVEGDGAPAVVLSATRVAAHVVGALPPPVGTPVCVEPGIAVHARPDGAFEIRSAGARVDVGADGCIKATIADDLDDCGSDFELLLALALALRPAGLYHVHGAALSLPRGRRVLVPAFSGCGKTTLTLAAIAAGAAYAGDDTLFLARRDGEIRVLGLARPFHVTDLTAHAFAALRPHLGARWGTSDKRVLEAGAAFPGRSRHELAAPDALLCPAIADAEETRLERLTAADGFCALLDASFFASSRSVPGLAEQLRIFKDVADGAVTYRALLGRDLLADPPAAVARIEDALARG